MIFIATKNAIAIHTDGSKIDNAASVERHACVSNNDPGLFSLQRSIHKQASIFTAETIALNYALDPALANVKSNILLFIHSLSVLQKLRSTEISIKPNSIVYHIKENCAFKEAAKRTSKPYSMMIPLVLRERQYRPASAGSSPPGSVETFVRPCSLNASAHTRRLHRNDDHPNSRT